MHPDPTIKYKLLVSGNVDDKGITLLIKWIYLLKNHPELIRDIKQLISTSPETINIQTNRGCTALQWASQYDIKEIVELLLEHNADPNLQNKFGDTALHAASYHGTEIVELLLKHNADPNLQNYYYGETALHDASFYSNTGVVELLLEYDAEPNLQNKRGTTALQVMYIYPLLLDPFRLVFINKTITQAVYLSTFYKQI